MNESIGILAWIPLLPLGIGLLIAVQLLYGARRRQADDLVRLVLVAAGQINVALGLIGVGYTFVGSATIAFVIGLVVLLVLLCFWYSRAHVNALLAAIGAGVARGASIEKVVGAFSEEGPRLVQLRAFFLTRRLADGFPLPEAIEQVHIPLTVSQTVAVHVGYATGRLDQTLLSLDEPEIDRLRTAYVVAIEKLLYLTFLMYVCVSAATFISIKLFPVAKDILVDFEVDLPFSTKAASAFSDAIAAYWFLFAIPALPLMLAPPVWILANLGWLPRDFPGVSFFTWSADGAQVLRALAICVRRRLPFSTSVQLLAERFPRARMRIRLIRALRRIQSGEDWADALHQCGVIRSREKSLLQSAERTGHLDWALDELARARTRLTTHRLNLTFQILYPIGLAVAGLVVAMYATAVISPLCILIENMS